MLYNNRETSPLRYGGKRVRAVNPILSGIFPLSIPVRDRYRAGIRGLVAAALPAAAVQQTGCLAGAGGRGAGGHAGDGVHPGAAERPIKR